MEIGVQTYMLRDYCNTREKLFETLDRLADMGVRNIHLAGTAHPGPAELRAKLDQNGQHMIAYFESLTRMETQIDTVIREQQTLGTKYVGPGLHIFIPGREDTYQAFVNFVHEFSPKLREAGLRFAYHNHDGEWERIFKGERRVWERLFDDIAPEDMDLIVDVFWVASAGVNPVDFLRQVKGRVPVLHFKDFGLHQRMCVVGEGNMDVEGILRASEDAGVQYVMIDQDTCVRDDPFDCVPRSIEALKAQGLTL